MSTKALHEALDYLENNPTADEAQDARRRARKELEDIEKAARFLASTSQDQDEAQRHMMTMERIAEETR